MRTMLLSFKCEIFEKIKKGEKVFEHRRFFPDEQVKAYVYVSTPIKAICGVMYLNKRHKLIDLKNIYFDDSACIERIDSYLKKYNYMMEINKFEESIPIGLDTLRSELSNFIVPQSYYYLEDTELLTYLENKLVINGVVIDNKFEVIDSKDICLN